MARTNGLSPCTHCAPGVSYDGLVRRSLVSWRTSPYSGPMPCIGRSAILVVRAFGVIAGLQPDWSNCTQPICRSTRLVIMLRFHCHYHAAFDMAVLSNYDQCPCLCLSVRSISPKPYARTSPNFSYVTTGRGQVPVWRQYNTLCTSGFVDEVVISLGPYTESA